nr:MAG: RNA-dependent RNA-polymerase [Picobirnavirus sp.]
MSLVIKKLTLSEQSIIDENNGMKMYLTNLVKDKPFTKRSWLYENREPNDVLNEWMERLSILERGTEFERIVFQFDTSQLKKWGPQGGHEAMSSLLPTIVLPSFERAEEATTPKAFNTQEWKQGVEATEVALRAYARNLRPAGYRRVVDDMRARDTLESNSGWPLFTRRNLPEVIKQSITEAESGDWKRYPAIALFRRYNGKTRLVWMYPMSVNLVEGSFFQPLQSALIRSGDPFFAPWIGFDEVREIITEAYDAGKYLAATDFSSTDEHFTYATSEQVVYVMCALFQDKYSKAIEESIARMHTIPLVIGTDEKIVGPHGVSSGSNWTNFIETVFDLELSKYVSIVTENQWKGFYAIGDDMCWISSRYDDAFANKIESIGKDVGQVINAEKVTNEPDRVKTLQRLFQRGYRRPDGKLRGVYPTIRALKSSIYPEKFHDPKLWSSDMFCARQYMILENCVDHPLFKEFVKFIVEGQKDLKPFARYPASTLNRIQKESKLLPGLNPTYNQEKRDKPLSDFESIEIARSL